MTPAAKIQEYIKKRVQETGGYYRKAKWENHNGCPDCFVWWKWPTAAFIEVKAGRDRLTKLQEREIKRMRDSGIPVYVVQNTNEVDVVLSMIKNGLQV